MTTKFLAAAIAAMGLATALPASAQGVKIGILAEGHGMECMPHGVGNVLHQAAHLHCELATPNSAFVEVPYPQGARDTQPYMKDVIRIAPDGYVHAPSKPGLGYEIDHAALDKAIVRIER